MFSGATPPSRQASPPSRAPSPPPEEPGNFTQLFSPKYNDPPPDDLSRRLNRGIEPTPNLHGATGTSMPAQRPPTPAQQQKPVEPGDFTKMFQAPTKPPGPGSAPSGGGGGGDYTDSLYGQQSDRAGSGMPPRPAGGPAPPPSPGGSEYTRALKRVSFGEMEAAKMANTAEGAKPGEKKGTAPGGAAPGDDEEKKPNYLPIILIAIGLIVVLVIVIVLFSSLSGL